MLTLWVANKINNRRIKAQTLVFVHVRIYSAYHIRINTCTCLLIWGSKLLPYFVLPRAHKNRLILKFLTHFCLAEHRNTIYLHAGMRFVMSLQVLVIQENTSLVPVSPGQYHRTLPSVWIPLVDSQWGYGVVRGVGWGVWHQLGHASLLAPPPRWQPAQGTLMCFLRDRNNLTNGLI